MSTKKRGRHSNGKQVPISPEFDQAVPSSPTPLPTKTPYRPIPQSYSTNSSTSSNISTSSSGSTFDVEKSTPSLDESPTTSDDEYSDSSRPKPAAQFGSLSDITSPLAPKTTGKRKMSTALKSNISSRCVDNSTSSKPALGIQTRSSKLRSSLTASKRESNISLDGSLSVPEASPTRVRSTSAPPASANLRHSPGKNVARELDIDRLLDLPGRYESQISNLESQIEAMAWESLREQDGTESEASPQSKAPAQRGPEGQFDEESTRLSNTPGPSISHLATPGYQRPHFLPYRSQKSDPTLPKLMEKCDINKAMLDFINKGHKRPKKPGWVYIFEYREDVRAHVKIGGTDRGRDIRMSEWEKCDIPSVKVPDHNDDPFYYHWFVESILKQEFCNERRKFDCGPCTKSHIEWFEIDGKTAQQAREKWRNWICIHEPYESGALKPFWQWRAKKIELSLSSVNWETWTQPSALDKLRYRYEKFDKDYRLGLVEHFQFQTERWQVLVSRNSHAVLFARSVGSVRRSMGHCDTVGSMIHSRYHYFCSPAV